MTESLFPATYTHVEYKGGHLHITISHKKGYLRRKVPLSEVEIRWGVPENWCDPECEWLPLPTYLHSNQVYFNLRWEGVRENVAMTSIEEGDPLLATPEYRTAHSVCAHDVVAYREAAAREESAKARAALLKEQVRAGRRLVVQMGPWAAWYNAENENEPPALPPELLPGEDPPSPDGWEWETTPREVVAQSRHWRLCDWIRDGVGPPPWET